MALFHLSVTQTKRSAGQSNFGTCNFKVFSKSSGKVVSEKNTIAIINIFPFGTALRRVP